MTEAATLTEPLPRWDLSSVYPDLGSAPYEADLKKLEDGLSGLERLFDQHGISRREGDPPLVDDALCDLVEEVIRRTNESSLVYGTLSGYAYASFSTDTYDGKAKRELSRLDTLDTRGQKLRVRLEGWLGWLEPRLPELAAARPLIGEHAFFLTHSARESRFLMAEALEGLAAELVVDGAGAFSKLQNLMTSQLKVRFAKDGTREEELPITVVRNLCSEADPDLRERAYHAEVAGWARIADPIATCLNAIKGTARTLELRRGRESVLDGALVQNRIDRETLDALLGAIRERFPLFRRYLKAKAGKLGKEVLPWWDLFAPVGSSSRTYSFDEARAFIVERFSSFSDELGAYAARAFDERWIDAEPRDGKVGGAYCMPIAAVEESRILANFDGSFDQVGTLAHELGHGFHNHCQVGLPALRRGAPSTLAETASIFCETLVAEAALKGASPGEQLVILEAQISGATQVCLDISSRFLFESRVLEGRAEAELSAEEMCELMAGAQAETYGDAIDPKTYHRYMWVWKPHYYSYGHNFYNFPYAFGHLFGLGLYAIYRREGDAFIDRYKALLRATGQDYAAPLARRFGIDITKPGFWRESLSMVEEQVERYEKL